MKEHEQAVFSEAVSFIRAHMAESLQVLDIARAIHVSESSLQRSFHACAGVSVHKYLLRMRLERAKSGLEHGETVGNMAKMVGFANRNHFSYCFKKEHGINPSQVRKKRKMP